MLIYEQNVEDFLVFYEGNFKRNYLDDISRIEKKNLPGHQNLLHFFLNRDGIYDKFPEGLFHRIDRFVKFDETLDSKSFKEEYELQKKEIIYARKFFQPFENEFFEKSLSIETTFGKNVSNPFQTFVDIFPTGIETFDIKGGYYCNIVSFLSFLSEIRGNKTKLQFFLKSLLQSKVEINQIESLQLIEFTDNRTVGILGNSVLGDDSFIGRQYSDFCILWNVTVFTQSSSMSRFVGNREFDDLIKFVKNNLIPAGIELRLEYSCDQYPDFTLSDNMEPENVMYLGCNIKL